MILFLKNLLFTLIVPGSFAVYLPLLIVGSQMQAGFRDDLYTGLLDTAGYPPSGPELPLEALRKMAAPEPTETQTQGARPATPQEPGAAK